MTEKATYLARAAEARAEAEAATLDNVRKRCLRSEAAWNEMASRAALIEEARARRATERAAAAADADSVID